MAAVAPQSAREEISEGAREDHRPAAPLKPPARDPAAPQPDGLPEVMLLPADGARRFANAAAFSPPLRPESPQPNAPDPAVSGQTAADVAVATFEPAAPAIAPGALASVSEPDVIPAADPAPRWQPGRGPAPSPAAVRPSAIRPAPAPARVANAFPAMTNIPAPPAGAEAVTAPPISGSARPLPAGAAAAGHPGPENQPASPPIAQPAADSNGGPEEQPSNVAFTVTLKPADTAPELVTPAAVPKPLPTEPNPPGELESPASPDLVPQAEQGSRPTSPAGSKQPDIDSEQTRKAVEAGAPPADAAGVSHILPNPVGPPDSQPTASSGAVVRTATPETPAAAATLQTASPDQPARAAAAHEIKLQVAGDGEQRVEVRISDRSGDVFVAVRTPDSRLSGDLRQNLPALAARLEQSGFHATAWQPGASGVRERIAEPQAGASGQDSQREARQNGREQQRDRQEQKENGVANPANAAQPNQPGRDFASLLSAIR